MGKTVNWCGSHREIVLIYCSRRLQRPPQVTAQVGEPQTTFTMEASQTATVHLVLYLDAVSRVGEIVRRIFGRWGSREDLHRDGARRPSRLS